MARKWDRAPAIGYGFVATVVVAYLIIAVMVFSRALDVTPQQEARQRYEQIMYQRKVDAELARLLARDSTR